MWELGSRYPNWAWYNVCRGPLVSRLGPPVRYYREKRPARPRHARLETRETRLRRRWQSVPCSVGQTAGRSGWMPDETRRGAGRLAESAWDECVSAWDWRPGRYRWLAGVSLAAEQPPLGGSLVLAGAGTWAGGVQRRNRLNMSCVWRTAGSGAARPGVESCGARVGVRGDGPTGSRTGGTGVGGTAGFDGTADTACGTTSNNIATTESVPDQHISKAPRRWRSLTDISSLRSDRGRWPDHSKRQRRAPFSPTRLLRHSTAVVERTRRSRARSGWGTLAAGAPSPERGRSLRSLCSGLLTPLCCRAFTHPALAWPRGMLAHRNRIRWDRPPGCPQATGLLYTNLPRNVNHKTPLRHCQDIRILHLKQSK